MQTVKYIRNASAFSRIPGEPIAYWASDEIINAFNNCTISEIGQARQGLATTDNDCFLRLWTEVVFDNIGFGSKNKNDALNSNKRWFPFNKGGSYRKWYGNLDYVINWKNDGEDLKKLITKRYGSASKRIANENLYFRECITWSGVAASKPSFRFSEEGSIFDVGANGAFFEDHETTLYLTGLLNTNIIEKIVLIMNPTINMGNGVIGRIPVCNNTEQRTRTVKLVDACIDISKQDWNDFETSWYYARCALVKGETMGRLIADKYAEWEKKCKERFDQLKRNEEELNKVFIDMYGLQDELTPEEEDKDVSVRLADKERDIKSLISYLIGVEFGRFSLDYDGLAYAGGEWDATKYLTYQPDDDGIVPIYNAIGMEDGLTTKIIKLIKIIYGDDTYRQNIDFIADALGKSSNESSEETLNRYLNDGFYADHLKTYQKRPIYWLFTSGKKAGFKCLIYMHRYSEDTLARINAKYFLPESTRKKNELDELNGKIAHAEGRDKLHLEKARQNLAAAYNEAIEYGQVLDHMANQYICIDLDDGVKVNYAKFQGVEIVTDGGSKVKKDLLAPLK